MKRLLKSAVLAVTILAAATVAQAGTVTWDTVRTEGMMPVSYSVDGTSYRALAGATVGTITGGLFSGADFYAFCTDPISGYVPHFEGTANLIQGDAATFLNYVYYGMRRNYPDYPAAQLAVWEIVTDVAHGLLPNYAAGSFQSGDVLAQSALDLIARGKLVAANSPAVQFWNIDPLNQHEQSFAVAMKVQAVPEPATSAIMALGLCALWVSRRRKPTWPPR